MSRQEFFALARGRFSTEELYTAYEAYVTCPALRGGGSFYCMRCGACCRRQWRIEVSGADVRRWIAEKRLDILGSLKCSPRKGPPGALAASRHGALVMPKDKWGCAYYDGSGCTIYDTRPGVCARFPDASLFEGLPALVQQR